MFKVFKLAFTTVLYQKLGVLMIALVAILPFVLAGMLINHKIDPFLLYPARAQAAWQLAWLIGIFWLLYQAASLGAEHTQSSIGSYFMSRQINGGSQLVGLWASCAIYAIGITVVASLVCVFGATPNSINTALHWKMMCFQQFTFILLVLLPMIFVAIALASRFGPTVGYLSSMIFILYGIYGVSILEKLAVSNDTTAIDFLYTISPHFYLGDLTHRFVHKQGALKMEQFIPIFEYLSGWALVLTGLSWFTFTPKKK